ncbi:MAG: MOSC domain-containing protein [Actinomycetota bacterium]
MASVRVGTVAQLWRYPVKSFQGEQVEEIELAPGGARGDRLLAVVDPAAKKVLSGKRYPALLHASARIEGGEVVISLPDGSTCSAADPEVHDALSRWLDLDVRLASPPADEVYPMEMHTGMSDEDTPIFDWPGPQGTWLDLADAHWLTTASLAAASGLYPSGAWDVRRFRPTALIEATGEGWAEDTWTTVELGEVRSDVLMPTPRCTLPSRAQPGFEADKTIGTTLRDRHDNNLGLYATITQAGVVRVGDPVCAS